MFTTHQALLQALQQHLHLIKFLVFLHQKRYRIGNSFSQPYFSFLAHMPLLLLTLQLTDCSYSCIPQAAKGASTNAHSGRLELTYGMERDRGSSSWLMRLVLEKLAAPAVQGHVQGKQTRGEIGLLFTHAHMSVSRIRMELNLGAVKELGFAPASPKNTSLHFQRQVINQIGPSSRISAFWQDSVGVKEVWGQAQGSTVRCTLQPDKPG